MAENTNQVVLVLGDDVSTDAIYPGRFMATVLPSETPKYAFADDAVFNPKLQKKEIAHGSVIVAGKNFGCGSSREQAASALKGHGLTVVARGIARIFLQNAINVGLNIVICAEIEAKAGDHLMVAKDKVVNVTTGREFGVTPLPESRQAIVDAGGLVPFTRKLLIESLADGGRGTRKYRIGWLPGDGIGIEVCAAARKVLDAVGFEAEYTPGDIGWEFWRTEGDALPPRTIELLKHVDAAMFGAITSKPVKEAEAELVPELRGKGLVYRSPIVRMRQLFDLYKCVRPCRAYAGNPLNFKEGIDLVVFRENTEGLYAGVEFNPVPPELSATLAQLSKNFAPFKTLAGDAYAITCKVNTRAASERIIRAAFEYAAAHAYPKVTALHKANVVRATEGLFLETAKRVAQDYPAIAMEDANVDAICMWLTMKPKNYGVLVATNLFGDIVSDLCAGLVGGLGFACSGNIGDELAVFEPTHGSAPKHAGKNKANPIATILAAKMMLDWLGEKEKAEAIEKAVRRVVSDGAVRTYDMGGTATTMDMATAVAAALP